jgi:hypothetical protein
LIDPGGVLDLFYALERLKNQKVARARSVFFRAHQKFPEFLQN